MHAKDNSLFHFFFAESNHQSVPEEKTVPTKLTRHHGIAAIFMAPMAYEMKEKGNYKTYRSSHRLYREIDESEILFFLS